MRRLISLLAILMFLSNSLYASKITDFFTGDSQEKRNNKASKLLETLLTDGTLTQSDENENFTSLLGSTADNVLIAIRNSIAPSVNNLSGSDISAGFHNIKKTSFLGMLIYFLIITECIILGIENFISDGISMKKIVSKVLSITFLLIFIAFLPTISDAILNIFSSMGMILSGNTNFSPPNPQHPFTYMPSDVLYTLNICKQILSIEHIRIGGYELSTIIPHFTVSIGEFLVSIPFILLTLKIVFWYCEMFLIFISGSISLPFAVFSKTDITDYKSILKAMLMQGLKICVGIFLATFIKDIIINSLKMIDNNFTSTTHAVLFAIFITLIIFFVITKGENIILSAINGKSPQESKSPLSFTGGLIAGGFAALGGSLSKISNAKGKNIPEIKTRNIETRLPNINSQNKNNTPDDKIQKIPGSMQKKSTQNSREKYGEVDALATKDRINAAKLELQNEGKINPSEKEIVQKAKNDAIISKLLKMEKKGFMLSDGRYNKPAAEQLKRLREKNG